VTPDEKAKAYVEKAGESYRKNLQLVAAGLSPVADWSAANLEVVLRALADSNGLKAGDVMQPVRIALTGSTVSEPVNELLHVIGKEAALERLGR
jgi:glutamyl-tRNA synthetase